MFRGKNILAIAAHPDDLEYGIFGTLLKYKQQSRIFCYIQTVGGSNDETSDGRRYMESVASMRLLGPHDIFLGVDDIGISQESYSKHVSELEDVLNEHNINLALVPSIHDTHQDHRLMHHISVSALRRRKTSVLFYTPLSYTTDFKPDVFVDITNFIELKRDALKAHASQSSKHYMADRYIEIFNRDGFAALHGLQYSEKFETGRCFF